MHRRLTAIALGTSLCLLASRPANAQSNQSDGVRITIAPIGASSTPTAPAPPTTASPPRVSTAPLAEESDELARLREAEIDAFNRPATVGEGAQRSGISLPNGVSPELAERLELPALVARLTPRIATEIGLYQTDVRARRALHSWFRHAARYRTRIEQWLSSEGVPSELVWVVAAESGFDPHDVSGVGAVGLWQLMPQTAISYGLRVDAWIDERKDPERATRAAARYLRALQQRLGSWELALAAYNMGYGAVLRSVRRFNTNDFETLANAEAGLAFETTHYVPRILAAAVAARNGALFPVEASAMDPIVQWEEARLTRSLPLDSLARAMEVSPEQLRALNPAIRGARTPPCENGEVFVLHVPPGTRERAEREATTIRLAPTRVVHLRYGETVSEIAAQYGTDVDGVLRLSGFASEGRITAGTPLLVPDREPRVATSTERPVVIVDPNTAAVSQRRRVFYRVVQGDELRGIARALELSREELLRWNSLDSGARLQPGMWLQAWIAPGANPPARVWEENAVELLVRGSDAFHDRTVALDGRVRVRVTVNAGDTMQSIARRYEVSVGTLARINRRARSAALTPGETLIVYARPENAEEEDPRSTN